MSRYIILSVLGVMAVEYMSVYRTSVNAYSIRIKVCKTENTAWVLLSQLSKMRCLYRESCLIMSYQISWKLLILVRPTYEAMSSVVA